MAGGAAAKDLLALGGIGGGDERGKPVGSRGLGGGGPLGGCLFSRGFGGGSFCSGGAL